jgi:hypothetical protein
VACSSVWSGPKDPAEPFPPGQHGVDEPQIGDRAQLGDDQQEVGAMPVLPVEIPFEHLARRQLGA